MHNHGGMIGETFKLGGRDLRLELLPSGNRASAKGLRGNGLFPDLSFADELSTECRTGLISGPKNKARPHV